MKFRIYTLFIFFVLGVSGGAFAGGTATCAVVYDYGWDNTTTHWLTNPVRAYCAVEDIGKICDIHVSQNINCTKSDEGGVPWYQAAIDYAANKNGSGALVEPGRRQYPVVALTRGVVNVKYPIEADWPLGKIGIHLQGGVQLIGVPAQFGTTLVKLDKSWNRNDLLNHMIVSSASRVGDVLNPGRKINSVVIDSIAISGSLEDAIPGCKVFDDRHSHVKNGVFVFNAEADQFGLSLNVTNLILQQLKGNAIELGFYSPFVDSGKASCTNDMLCKQGLILDVSGKGGSDPAYVAYNNICGVGYGGITIIGKNVKVEGNSILHVAKTWDGENKSVGSTMGISIGFVGSSSNYVINNVIEGGDYGVGSDGSFPVFIMPEYYKKYWSAITEVHPEFSIKYPNGPVDSSGKAYLKPMDDILANQVLMDVASKRAAQVDDRVGFVIYPVIQGNRITNSTVGVSLFKVDGAKISNNVINSTSKSKFGILFDSAVNSFAYDNRINWWPVGVYVTGMPYQVSKWGSSYNGIGIKPPLEGSNQWAYPGNIFQGNIRNVVIEKAGSGNNIH
ncbi:hypothetical protein HNQ59_002399 [Chitinivorax tropicus]|uniref:Right-handed parallel beta-helix repeat-containing protein n=2 Tax=Chitinivorax tropicus TaxID=714531 RepID=A0A840MVA0_9PROT|nr:hypothetical protein [Chitinivorax tropicus]